MQYLVLHINQGLKDLDIENYKILMKNVEDKTNKWIDILCSWVWIITVIKISILPNVIYRFNLIPVKILMAFFTYKEKIHL